VIVFPKLIVLLILNYFIRWVYIADLLPVSNRSVTTSWSRQLFLLYLSVWLNFTLVKFANNSNSKVWWSTFMKRCLRCSSRSIWLRIIRIWLNSLSMICSQFFNILVGWRTKILFHRAFLIWRNLIRKYKLILFRRNSKNSPIRNQIWNIGKNLKKLFMAQSAITLGKKWKQPPHKCTLDPTFIHRKSPVVCKNKKQVHCRSQLSPRTILNKK